MHMDAPEAVEYTPEPAPETATKYLYPVCSTARLNRGILEDSARAPRSVLREADGRAHALPRRGARALLLSCMKNEGPAAATARFLPDSAATRTTSAWTALRKTHASLKTRPPAGWKSRSTFPSPKRIRATSPPQRNAKQAGYPKCMLCRRKSRLRGPHRISRAPEPSHDSADAGRKTVVFAVFAVSVLRRALHRIQRRTHADAHLP